MAIEKQKLDMKRDRRNERYERDDRSTPRKPMTMSVFLMTRWSLSGLQVCLKVPSMNAKILISRERWPRLVSADHSRVLVHSPLSSETAAERVSMKMMGLFRRSHIKTEVKDS
ncbi:hypothetical protein BV898_19302 [Hypsibius exemplaris]|uniref:Uncharacterized protein n=1 Tax=Hypsibius exemplaris TaxID=2072580 RepID=A0A9X6NQG6_HYPEX|nr:hypothetical protein BV898_19302 [Hypsibius exemplaris]